MKRAAIIAKNTVIAVYPSDKLVATMRKNGILAALIEAKRRFIEALKPSNMKEHDGKSFTRRRRLFLARLLTIVLRCNPSGLQIRLDDYYKEIGYRSEVVTKQAFSKARTKLDPEVVRDSFRLTAQTLCSCEDLELYRGQYRLCAIDGSTVALDNAKELLEHFGGSGSNNDCATALASVCFDPLNNIILDGGLYPYGTSERDAARKHFEEVPNLPLPNDAKNLYIFDRGYPSKQLFSEMIDADICFLMRVRKKFNTDFDLSCRNEKVTFKYGGKRYEVRVFKVILESGTKFDSLKNKLELENFSGRRICTTYQDFWAKLDLANTLTALEYATDEAIEAKTANSSNKYKQTTNENRLITKFTERYIEILTIEEDDVRLMAFEELIKDIVRHPVEVKPNRKHERKPPRKKKFCDRRKRALA